MSCLKRFTGRRRQDSGNSGNARSSPPEPGLRSLRPRAPFRLAQSQALSQLLLSAQLLQKEGLGSRVVCITKQKKLAYKSPGLYKTYETRLFIELWSVAWIVAFAHLHRLQPDDDASPKVGAVLTTKRKWRGSR